MITEIQGNKITVTKDNGKTATTTAEDLFEMVDLWNSIFGDKPTHQYISNDRFSKLEK